MTHLLAQVVIPYRSGLPEDVSVNTFHFMTLDDEPETLTEVYGRLVEFYNTTVATWGQKIITAYSGELNIAGTRCKIYNQEQPEPRPPVLNESMGLSATPGSSTNLPGEVALCASYSAEPEAGAVAARRRGRIYLGPFNVSAGTSSDGNSPSRPQANYITGINIAMKRLADRNTAGVVWSVWSRRNNSAAEIVRGWTDNAWDTQRRRGGRPSSRANWAVEI